MNIGTYITIYIINQNQTLIFLGTKGSYSDERENIRLDIRANNIYMQTHEHAGSGHQTSSDLPPWLAVIVRTFTHTFIPRAVM